MGKNDGGEEGGSVDVILPDGFGSSFSTKEIRAKFIRKVYATLLSQLCITIGFIAIFVLSLQLGPFSAENKSGGTTMGSGIVSGPLKMASLSTSSPTSSFSSPISPSSAASLYAESHPETFSPSDSSPWLYQLGWAASPSTTTSTGS